MREERIETAAATSRDHQTIGLALAAFQ